jgi:putative membrane protein
MPNPPSPDSADRRTELAADRTVFAAERTYAAWVRTGLAALASGVGAQTLLEGALPAWSVRIVGSMLVLFSAFSFAAAVWREARPGLPPPKSDVPRLSPWLLIAINAFLVLVALSAFVGIWLGKVVTE